MITRVAPHALGIHRVVDPADAMPQQAWKLDNTPIALANEILCDVDALNIDSASFKQISDACGQNITKIAERILEIVRERGKMHNPVTGSGGMFIGRVREVGERLRGRIAVAPGDRIASLVSLTLTPLAIESIADVDVASGRVRIRGTAILFERSLFARLPDDIDESVSLAVLDVAGAPAQVQRLCRAGQTVVVIGADGKSGMLACAAARSRVGADGRVIGVAPSAQSPAAQLLVAEGYVDEFVAADACDTLQLLECVSAVAPELADLTVTCVNVDCCELGSILCTKDGGTVLFFSMCTSFTSAALGAEGVAKDVTMIVGNGYAPGHADVALQTLRDHPAIHQYFRTRYAQPTEIRGPA